jgi:hypothetical protein
MTPKKQGAFISYFNNSKLQKYQLNLSNAELLILSSEIYCIRYDCERTLLKRVNVNYMSKIINKFLELNN